MKRCRVVKSMLSYRKGVCKRDILLQYNQVLMKHSKFLTRGGRMWAIVAFYACKHDIVDKIHTDTERTDN